MNFNDLLKIVPSTEEGDMPKAASLSESPVILTKEYGGAIITVHENGYYTYQENGHTTVYAVDRCADYVDPADPHAGKIPYEKIAELDWYVPLAMFGRSRIEHNNNTQANSHNAFSLNNDGSDYSVFSPSIEDVLKEAEEEREYQEKMDARKKELARVLNSLTDIQRYCIMESFYGKKSKTQIAKDLGCSQQAVSKNISAGLKKAKKAFDKLGIK